MNWVMLFSILTGILAICTAIAQSMKERKDNEERLADKNEIIKLQKENNNTLQEVNSLQNQIITSNNKLIEANERIEALNVEQINYQSGGDSYPFVDVLKILDNKGQENLSLAVNRVGKYPLYDVNVTYWNLDETSQLVRPDGRADLEILEKYKSVNVGTLSQNGSKPIGTIFKLNEDGLLKINLSIDTKNGKFSELLRINKSGKNINYAYKVNTVTDGKSKPKVLKEYVAPSFPKNPDGSVNWK